MYKNILYGIVIFMSCSISYILIRSGGLDVLINAYHSEPQINYEPASIDSVSGVYVCEPKYGCNKTYALFLKDDQTVQMITPTTVASDTTETTQENSEDMVDNNNTLPTKFQEIIKDNQNSSLKEGHWDIASGNIVIITFSGSDNTINDSRQKIIIKKVATTTLSNLFFNKKTYSDMTKPIFFREY